MSISRIDIAVACRGILGDELVCALRDSGKQSLPEVARMAALAAFINNDQTPHAETLRKGFLEMADGKSWD